MPVRTYDISQELLAGFGEGDTTINNSDVNLTQDGVVRINDDDFLRFGDISSKGDPTVSIAAIRIKMDVPVLETIVGVKVTMKAQDGTVGTPDTCPLRFALWKVGREDRPNQVGPVPILGGGQPPTSGQVTTPWHLESDENQIAHACWGVCGRIENDAGEVAAWWDDVTITDGHNSFTFRETGIRAIGGSIKNISPSAYSFEGMRLSLTKPGAVTKPGVSVVVTLYDTLDGEDDPRADLSSVIAVSDDFLWDDLPPHGTHDPNDPLTWVRFVWSTPPLIAKGKQLAWKLHEKGELYLPDNNDTVLRLKMGFDQGVTQNTQVATAPTRFPGNYVLTWGLGGFSEVVDKYDEYVPKTILDLGNNVAPEESVFGGLVAPANGAGTITAWTPNAIIAVGEPRPTPLDGTTAEIPGLVALFEAWKNTLDVGDGTPYDETGQMTCLLTVSGDTTVSAFRDLWAADPDAPGEVGIEVEITTAPATILVVPSEIRQSVVEGNDARSQTFTISMEKLPSPLVYTVADDVAWLSVNPGTGSTSGELDVITITYDTDSLEAGNYLATISVTDFADTSNVVTIPVYLTVVEKTPGTVRRAAEVNPTVRVSAEAEPTVDVDSEASPTVAVEAEASPTVDVDSGASPTVRVTSRVERDLG